MDERKEIDNDKNPRLTEEEAKKYCGFGTNTACFALEVITDKESTYWECLWISNEKAANLQGIRTGWKTNEDPDGGRPRCPKGILQNSKKPPKPKTESSP